MDKCIFPIAFFISILTILVIGCTGMQTNNASSRKTDKVPLLTSLTDSRDGEVYSIVKIGEQLWMAENLRYDAPGSWLHADAPSKVYGRLYDGLLVQKVCPQGWHLPSDMEWSRLEMTLGMQIADIAKTGWRGTHGVNQMSTIEGWFDKTNRTNSSGFSAFPAGFYFDGEFGGLEQSTGFWSSIHDSEDKAWTRFIGSGVNYSGMNRFKDALLEWGLSCRCVRD